MRKWWLNWKLWAGMAALAGALAVWLSLRTGTPRLALYWLFGLLFGVIVQRSRFCFVSAIGNFTLFRDGRLLKGILAGLFIATIGFAVIMYQQSPDPASGIPAGAYVSPFGWHLVLAGIIFGLGMVLAGGCILGTLYRIGEGAVASLVALLGIIIGMGVLQHNWPWWYRYISTLPAVWLPQHIGWIASVALTLVVIAALFWLVSRSKTPGSVPDKPKTGPVSLKTRLSSLGRAIFVNGWPLAAGGVILGGVNVWLFAVVQRPWGLTGEVMRWTQNLLDAIHLSAPPVGTVPGS